MASFLVASFFCMLRHSGFPQTNTHLPRTATSPNSGIVQIREEVFLLSDRALCQTSWLTKHSLDFSPVLPLGWMPSCRTWPLQPSMTFLLLGVSANRQCSLPWHNQPVRPLGVLSLTLEWLHSFNCCKSQIYCLAQHRYLKNTCNLK